MFHRYDCLSSNALNFPLHPYCSDWHTHNAPCVPDIGAIRAQNMYHRGVGFGCYNFCMMVAGSLMSYATGLVLDTYTSDVAIKVKILAFSYFVLFLMNIQAIPVRSGGEGVLGIHARS